MNFVAKECIHIDWRVKSFNYCWASIKSPEFACLGDQCWLELDPNNLECRIASSNTNSCVPGNISFLTCDGSEAESQSHTPVLSVSKDTLFGQRRNAFLPKDTLTIRCHILDYNYEERGTISVKSRIGVKHKSLLLTMRDLYREEKKLVENSDQYGNIKLNLKSVGGINSDEQFYIEISRKGGESCYCVLKVAVLDNNGKVVNNISDEYIFQKENREQFWRFPPIIRNSKLLACKNLLLPNGYLSLKCDFAVTLGKVTDEIVVYSNCKDVISLLKDSEDTAMYFKSGGSSDSNTNLKTDLRRILDTETLCDVSLQVGSEVIQSHKNILSARSPVFKAMFTKDMKETINKTVIIEDLDADTMRRLLLYMYTDVIHDYQWENIMNLYFAADKYEVLGLKQKCSSFLKENVSFSNVCEVLFLADLHQDSDLRSIVHDFISKYESEVFSSAPWKELENSNSTLACQTLREICANKRLD